MQTTRNFVIALAMAATLPAFAKSDPVNKNSSGVAIKGYDPVAYFTESKPVKGSPEYSYPWMGATWQFSSASNRDLFAKSPEKYAPRYGGYCAYGVSRGHTVSIDPEAWSVVEGRLYLNYSRSVKESWSKAIPENIGEADRRWPDLHK